jgi:hypothetical protein
MFNSSEWRWIPGGGLLTPVFSNHAMQAPCQPVVEGHAGKLLKINGIFSGQKLWIGHLWAHKADSTSKSRIFT